MAIEQLNCAGEIAHEKILKFKFVCHTCPSATELDSAVLQYTEFSYCMTPFISESCFAGGLVISYSGSSGEKEKLGLLVTPKRVQGRPLDYREGHSSAFSPPTSLCIAKVSAISMF